MAISQENDLITLINSGFSVLGGARGRQVLPDVSLSDSKSQKHINAGRRYI